MEQGPELVTMPTGAKVHNANKTQDMLSGGNQVFEITVPVQIDGRTIASATAKFTNREIYNITQQNKRGGRLR